MNLSAGRIVVASLLIACGGSTNGPNGGGPDAPPSGSVPAVLIAGGGVGTSAIDGTLHVHVIDDATGQPIAGATVRIGDAFTAVTNAGGLATIIDDSLTSAVDVTVTVAGYAAATWFGVAAANVTVNLAASQSSVPTATVTGTIAGWDSLPAPSFTNYTLAVVLYSFTSSWGSAENTIAQPMNGDTPKNTCIRSAFSSDPCAWEMNTRTGRQVHFAVIVDGDSKGTTDTADDTYTLIGYAVKTGLDLSPGQRVTGETLEMISVGTQNVTVTFPAAPSGTPDRLAFPFIDMGADGQLPFALPTLAPGSTTTQVPALTGPFAGASYSLVGLALPGNGDERPYSASFVRDVSFGGGVGLDAYLPAPSQLQAGGSFAFAPAAGANLHIATVADAGGNPLWTAVLLDGRTSFVVPSPDLLPTGALELRVAAVDFPGFDPTDFTLENQDHVLARAAEAAIGFTH